MKATDEGAPLLFVHSIKRSAMKLVSLSALLLCLLFRSLPAQPYQRVTQLALSPAQVNGTWSNGHNTFRIRLLSDGRLQLDFDGAYSYRTPRGERMANVGTFVGLATVDGNIARISNVNEAPECRIILTFSDARLAVVQEGMCGFGNGVTADGTYKRTSQKVPKIIAIEGEE